MKKLLFCLFLTVILLAGDLFADNGIIKGRIVDSETGDALPGTNVLIKGTNMGAATDLRGYYIIGNVPPGEYTLKITYIGYASQELTLFVGSGETVVQDFELVYGQVVRGETVVVTAQASGQYTAINQQLASNTIANIVSQARIQELPDVNAAESIGRLPGVSIERTGGEATKVAIRGLSPKYNTVTVNGVRVPATGGDDRSTDLSLISSNMLDGIEVKKAITPDMDADAIGGTVDLKLREASDQMELNITMQGGYNQLQDYYGNYNFTGNLSNRFNDGRLGVIASFNKDNYDRSADKFSGTYRERLADNKLLTQSLILREETVDRGRTGASLLLDYRLPNGKVMVNAFFNRLKWDGLYRINRMHLTNPGSSNRHYYDFEDRGGTTSIFTGSAGIEQDFGWIRYDGGFARTASRSDNPNEKTWTFIEEYGAYIQNEFEADTDPTEIPAYAVNDTFRTFLSEVWIWDTDREENQTSFQFNIQMPFSFGKNISGYLKTGGKFRWLDRMNDAEYEGRHGIQYGDGGNEMEKHLDGAIPEWGVQDFIDEYGHLPIKIFLDNYTRSNFLDGDYPLGFTIKKAMLDSVTQVLSDSGDVLPYSINSLASDYDGIERYGAGYIMAEFDIGKYFTFLPGIRYEKDYSKYTGYRFREQVINNIQGPPADLDTLENVREHEFWLPMVHLNVQPNDWLKIRLAYTESLTRPDFIQYAPTTRINNYFTYLRAANAQLRPAQSTNYDASISVYQNYVGLFTVSGFYKDIKDLIFQTSYQFKPAVPVPEGFNIPENWLKDHTPNADLYINNPFKATYKGFELDWQTHFW
ncbi:MAG: TonB-dependent receptor, partial [bacterium]